MNKPDVLKFTDYDVNVKALTYQLPQSLAPSDWTRVKFTVPGTHEAPKQVCEWLVSNCVGDWRQHNFPDPKSKNNERTMVVKFQSRDDALMFKLRGGHQAWQENS
jgi:hypothetical protein